MSVSVPTRVGPDGCADKCALIYAQAKLRAQDPKIRLLALQICQSVGSRAVDCVRKIDEWVEAWQKSKGAGIVETRAIEAYASQRQYRGEHEDELRDPLVVAMGGGDCDDAAVLVGALLISIGIPFEPEIVGDDACVAFHVRAVAGLPPGNPTQGYVIDPVLWTEREWQSKPDIPANRRTEWHGPRNG